MPLLPSFTREIAVNTGTPASAWDVEATLKSRTQGPFQELQTSEQAGR
jgi:hypothetical protein